MTDWAMISHQIEKEDSKKQQKRRFIEEKRKKEKMQKVNAQSTIICYYRKKGVPFNKKFCIVIAV